MFNGKSSQARTKSDLEEQAKQFSIISYNQEGFTLHIVFHQNSLTDFTHSTKSSIGSPIKFNETCAQGSAPRTAVTIFELPKKYSVAFACLSTNFSIFLFQLDSERSFRFLLKLQIIATKVTLSDAPKKRRSDRAQKLTCSLNRNTKQKDLIKLSSMGEDMQTNPLQLS